MSIERYSKFISEQVRKTTITTQSATLEGGVPTVINGRPVPGAGDNPNVIAARELGAFLSGSSKNPPKNPFLKVKPTSPKKQEPVKTHKNSSIALTKGESSSGSSGTPQQPKLLNPEKKSDDDLFSTTTNLKTVDGSIGREAEKNLLSKNDVGAVQRAKAIAMPPAPEKKSAPEKKDDSPGLVIPGEKNLAAAVSASSTPEKNEPESSAPESAPKPTKRERVISGAKERLTRSQRMSKAMHSGDLQGVVSGTYGESTEIK